MKTLVLAALSVMALTGEPAAAQICEPRWLPGSGRPGANDEVYAFEKFDFDGPGGAPEELVVGGSFTQIGDAYGSGAARWDGQRWLPLGAAGVQVCCFATFDADGPGPQPPRLFAAGAFSDLYHSTVLRWSGQEWEDVGIGLGFSVKVICSFDLDGGGPLPPRLIAGGEYNTGPFHSMAQWDGTQWLSMSGGVQGGNGGPEDVRVAALASVDPDGPGPELPRLIATGSFYRAGGLTVNSIAAWNGKHWEGLGTGLQPLNPEFPGYGSSLIVFDVDGPGPLSPQLIVGGQFTAAGGVTAPSVARWDGNSWSPVGTGFAGTPSPVVHGLVAYDEDGEGPNPTVLVASGDFAASSDLEAFDGSNWTPIGGILAYQNSNGTQPLSTYSPPGSDHPLLMMGGHIRYAGWTAPFIAIAARDGSAWRPVHAGFDGPVTALTVFDMDGSGPGRPEVIVGGSFTTTPDGRMPQTARFDGTQWRPLSVSPGVVPTKFKVLPFDGEGHRSPTLFLVGGGGVKKWTGTEWSNFPPLPSGTGSIMDVEFFDFSGSGSPSLVAAAEGWVGSVWRLDGGLWQQVGQDLIQYDQWNDATEMRSLAVMDTAGGPVLVVGGFFNTDPLFIYPPPFRNIAQWNGSRWMPLAPGSGSPGDRIRHLISYDPDGPGPAPAYLVAGCVLPITGAWDGVSWRSISLWQPFTIFDADGDGPLQPVLVGRGAYWNGNTSVSLAGPVGHTSQGLQLFSNVNGIAIWQPSPHDPGQIVMGGSFDGGGGLSSVHVARLTCSAACYANCDGSSGLPVLTSNDLFCFINRFLAGDAYANCDGSSVVPVLNVADFQCFLSAFSAGCP